MAQRTQMSRSKLLEELSITEIRYCKRIKSTCAAYIDPLRATRMLSPQELGAIFRNLESIRDVHTKKLQGEIQTAVDGDGGVAACVALVASALHQAHDALAELYTVYARTFGEAQGALQAVRARPEASRNLAYIASQDHRVEGEDLEELLALPITHAANMRELTSALLSQCGAADPGYSHLMSAVELFNGIVARAEEAGWRGEGGRATLASAATPYSTRPGPTPTHPSLSQMVDDQLRAAGGNPASTSSDFTSSGFLTTSAPTPAASTATLYHNSLPFPSLSSDLPHVTMESVVAAQNEADRAARQLDELEREVELKEKELKLAREEVLKAERDAAAQGSGQASNSLAVTATEESLRALQAEERELYARMASSEHRGVYEAFLQRKKDLEEEESRLMATLMEHEETLSQIRARLANPPSSVLPSDPAKASLYIAWKRALAEREEYLRQARRRKHELLRDLKARFETQVVLLEMERRNAVDGLKEAVTVERAKVEGSKKELARLEEEIESARAAMKKFRSEFESLRVGLLIDRMAKSGQVASLAERRQKLQREAEQFSAAVEAARQQVAAEESAKWEARLRAEREAGEKRVNDEKKLIDQKIEQVRTALAERYEAGFRPLLRETEARHVEELQKVVALQRELEAKEAELRAAHEAARGVSAAVNAAAGEEGVVRDPTSGEVVPEWKLREFEDLKSAVAGLWEQLDVPAEDVTAFLSEADLMAPYSPHVLDMYQDMYQRLSANLPPVPTPSGYYAAPTESAPPSSYPSAPRYGVGEVSPPHARTPAHMASSSSSSMPRSMSGAPPSLGGPGARASGKR